MKRILAILVVLSLVFAAVPAMAADKAACTKSTTENGMMPKLGRGFLNVLDGVVEIPGTMMRTSDAEGVGVGLTKGLLMGAVNTVVRVVTGAYEIVTFPIPIPADYAPILDEPLFLNKA